MTDETDISVNNVDKETLIKTRKEHIKEFNKIMREQEMQGYMTLMVYGPEKITKIMALAGGTKECIADALAVTLIAEPELFHMVMNMVSDKQEAERNKPPKENQH